MTDSNDWSQVWLDAQKQYWNQLFDWSRATGQPFGMPGGTGAASGPEAWWQSFATALPADSQALYRKAMASAQQLMAMGESFWRMGQEAQSANDQWREGMQAWLDTFKQSIQFDPSATQDAWSSFAGVWGLQGDAWQDFMKTLGQSPVNTADLAGVNAGDAWARILKTPAMGYSREFQEQLQGWTLRAGEHAKAMQAYAELLNGANRKAVDILGQRMLNPGESGEAVTTLRGLYDLWVDCGEEAYAELAVDEAFLEAQGDLTNTLMRMKQAEQGLQEHWLSALNMPTQRELDTALCRLHQTRRELRDLQDSLDDAEVIALRAEVDDLRARLEALEGGRPAAPAAATTAPATAPAAVKKAPARKKTTTKKKTPVARGTGSSEKGE